MSGVNSETVTKSSNTVGRFNSVGRLAVINLGWMMAVGASFSYSVATPITRSALLTGADPNALLLGRMILALLLLLATMLVVNRGQLLADRRCLLLSLGAGTLNGFGMISYFWGLTRIEASMAAMIISTSPLIVLSMLALRGERFTYRHIIRVVLALGGVYLLIGPGGQVDLIGIALIFLAILAFASQLVMMQWFMTGYPAYTVIFYQLVAMTLVVFGWWWSRGEPWHVSGTQSWMAIIVLAVVSTYAARLLTFGAVGRIGGGQIALLAPVETLLAVFWSILFLGEHLTAVQWIGSVLILTSAVLAIQRINLGRWRPRRRVLPRP